MQRDKLPAFRWTPAHALLSFLLICHCGGVVFAEPPKLVELQEEGKSYQGKIVGRTDSEIWLMERDGQLRKTNASSITGFRKVAEEFTPFSDGTVRDILRREFRGMEVVGTGHYLVVGPPKVVRDYAQLFEDHYRAFRNYFSVRGFDIREPEFPLIAVVYPDQKTFARHALADGHKVTPGVKGYYLPLSNRVSLYHETPVQTSDAVQLRDSLLAPGHVVQDLFHRSEDNFKRDLIAFAGMDGSTESTMIHESTHQVAFNTGIHHRLGKSNPRWVVEGLAMTFEAPGISNSNFQRVPGAKINRSRLDQFREFVKLRRQPKTLSTFVQGGNLEGLSLLDGYAQSWALTYYLIETRPRDYSRYLKLIMSRPPLLDYTDGDRIADFKDAFGNDVNLIEAKFLRYMDEVR